MNVSVKMNVKSRTVSDLTKILLLLVILLLNLNLSAQTESTCSKATEVVVKSIGTNSVTIGYFLPAGIAKAYLDVVKYTAPVTDATVWMTKEINVPSTSIERGDLLPGTTYVFRIRTLCSNSATVNVTTPRDFVTLNTNVVTCDAATGVSVLGTTANAVKIGYTLPAGSSISTLLIVAATPTPTDATVWLIKEIAPGSTYTERGDLLPSTKYIFKIKTVCTNGTVKYTTTGDFITTAATLTTCAAATSVSVSSVSATSVKVNFKLPADVASASLEIFAPNSTTAMSKTITPLTATSVERLELIPSTKYTYKIKTTCGNNVVNYSATGDFSTSAAPVNTVTCSEATGLSVKSIGANGVKIGYTLPAGDAKATLLVVAANPTPTDATLWLIKEIAPGSTYTERGDLLPSTKYLFKVKTVCTNGTIKYSSTGDFTTPAATAALPPCSPATNVTVSNITSNTATFNYTLPLGIASATLEVIPANSIAWLTRNLTTTSTSYVRNELMLATKYYFRIRTVCGNGTVSYTPEANFSTPGNKNGELTAADLSAQSGSDLTVNCFPNPATSGITVNILGGGGQMVDLQLSNLYGTVVFQSKFSQSEIQNINVGSYPRGIYVLRVSVAGKTNSLKIVLN